MLLWSLGLYFLPTPFHLFLIPAGGWTAVGVCCRLWWVQVDCWVFKQLRFCCEFSPAVFLRVSSCLCVLVCAWPTEDTHSNYSQAT